LINAHLDSPIGDTEERARQLRQCSGLLQGTSSTLRVLCGDFNIFSTDELSKVIPMHLEDSILSSNLDPAVEDPDSATLGITFATPDERRLYPPRRSDFVFWVGENWECVRHENRGREPVLDESGNPIKCARGVDGYLHASDHLAVLVDFRLGKGQE
jgi:endonuclease/exonuclease/phosphatase family metal-dependent hydrolase